MSFFKHHDQSAQGSNPTASASGSTEHSSLLPHHHQQHHEGQPHGAPAPPAHTGSYITSLIPAHQMPEFQKELVQAAGEMIGTFYFLFIGFGAIQASVLHVEHFLLSISISFGLALTTAVWLTYRISGGALNPAVVFAVFVLGKMPARKAALYVVGELLGASLAALAVSTVIPGAWGRDFKGANVVFAPTGYLQAVALEALLTSGL
ncbi:hypothetical protein HK101_010295, partial [Irineochytrium annulatum]